ncbi:hypothetical protein, partial [Rodentibacter trehalosifermentans]
VSQVYGNARAEVNRYRELEQYHANQESDKDGQLARKYRYQANNLSSSLSQNYQSGTGLFSLGELYANKEPLAKTMFETIAESGYAVGVGGTAKAGTILNYAETKLPKGINANEALPVVGKTTGYENQTTRISAGAENIALYPKLKEDLAKQQQAGFEKVIKDLSKKPEGSVLLISDYRQQLAEARATLPSSLQGKGNAAVAQINIEGLATKTLAGHSQITEAQGVFVG